MEKIRKDCSTCHYAESSVRSNFVPRSCIRPIGEIWEKCTQWVPSEEYVLKLINKINKVD